MSVDLKGIFGNRIKIDSKVRSILGVFFNQDSQEVTDYMPSYQRNYVWDDEKATYFIESIFLGTEIPPLVYYKTVTDEAIKNEVIDGRQRYQSILRFINGDLRLRNYDRHLSLVIITPNDFGRCMHQLAPTLVAKNIAGYIRPERYSKEVGQSAIHALIKRYSSIWK